MPTPIDRFLTASGLRLHYLDWGSPQAPLFLLLHGGSAHAHWWDYFAAAVADRYHVVALDLRGHGDSDHSRAAAYSLDDYAGDVAAAVAALNPPALVIMGHSLGALVAIVYASRTELPLEALILVDIRVCGGESGWRILARLGSLPHPVYSSREDAVERFRLLPSVHAADPAMLEHVAVHGLRALPDGRSTPKFDRAALSAVAACDLRPDLARLTCPILYIRGAKSSLVPRVAADEVKDACPQAQTVELPDAFHHLMLDNPKGFERVVCEFLAAAGSAKVTPPQGI